MKITLTSDECAHFLGEWSLEGEFVRRAVNATDWKRNSVLEFGSGDSTGKLFHLLKSKLGDVEYVSYENDPEFACPDVTTVLYQLDRFPILLCVNEPDLVIVDGPTGRDRKKWYPLLTRVVRAGTILAVDDVGHFYPEFWDAIADHFQYEEVFLSGERDNLRTWLIAKVIAPRIA